MQAGAAVRVCIRVPSLCGYFIQEYVCSAAGPGLTGRYSGELRRVSVITAQPRL